MELPLPRNDCILALDFATRTGWAIRHPDGKITSGTVSFSQGRFEGGGMRYLNFRKWLEQRGKIDAVYFEAVYFHTGANDAQVYGGFMAALTMWCEEHKIPYDGIAWGTIKKFATGKGNASKQEVIEAVKKLGHKPKDDNESDALALLHWAMKNHYQGVSKMVNS
jgi:Holliday junction resolvasome RuvABC endonuclease subunit